jgi:hypothetical protein
MDEILEPLRPGRAGPLGLVHGLGLTTEEYNTFPQQEPITSCHISLRILHFFFFKKNKRVKAHFKVHICVLHFLCWGSFGSY